MNLLGKTVLAGFLVVLVSGCSGSGSAFEELDPIEASEYLFAQGPDRTVVKADPDNPNHELIWEFRNRQRVQSFLARSCPRGDRRSCRVRLLGYSQYRLDGSVEIAVSLPKSSPGGTRAEALDRFVSTTGACVASFDAKGQLLVTPRDCNIAHVDQLMDLLSTTLEELNDRGANFGPGCALTLVAALSCQENPSGDCREILSGLVDCADAIHSVQVVVVCDQACMQERREACYSSYNDTEFSDIAPDSECGGFQASNFGKELPSEESRLNGYGCARTLDESGPEVIYPFFAETSGMLYVELTKQESLRPNQHLGDLDLFLLKGSCESPESTCLQHGDSKLYESVEKGNCYYIVVDGYQGSVGSHELVVFDPHCSGKAGCADKECGDSCMMETATGPFYGVCNSGIDCVLREQIELDEWCAHQVVDLSDSGLPFAVSVVDERKRYKFEEAQARCIAKGMRLPSRNEAAAMYCHADLPREASYQSCDGFGTSNRIKGLRRNDSPYIKVYWLSERYEQDDRAVYVMDFSTAEQRPGYVHTPFLVRCVKSL